MKQTNEIGMFISLMDTIEIADKDITVDALLTQRKLASYIVTRKAHYHFTVKDNQPTLRQDIEEAFKHRHKPNYVEVTPPDHGRVEIRRIWTTSKLNDYLDFPHVGQAFCIEREIFKKSTQKTTIETIVGVTSRPAEQASAKQLLELNRGHWSIENKCHYVLDWNFNEDQSRIRTGNGPENITRLRRFAIGVIARVSDKKKSVAEQMRSLQRNTRLVFDYLKMTKNSMAGACV